MYKLYYYDYNHKKVIKYFDSLEEIYYFCKLGILMLLVFMPIKIIDVKNNKFIEFIL